MNPSQFTPGDWSLEYVHGNPGIYRIKAGDHNIVTLPVQEKDDESNANAHLIAAAPMLYRALKELLISTEEALITDNIGCECQRCEKAKYAANRAIGFAEGKTILKEGDPKTF